MEATTARTPQEVFQHHAEALGAEDLDGIISDYTDDAIFITPDGGVLRGKDGVRQGFVKLLGDVPGATWDLCRPRSTRTTSCCSSGRPSPRRRRSRMGSIPSRSAMA
jgi:SnoaL-like domain